jgi:4-hydroxy-3-methylbut-2-enyl diphosphate reductase
VRKNCWSILLDSKISQIFSEGDVGLKIILAKQAGFCFGVKRATQMAFEAAAKGGKTFTLGPIIHSPQVVQRLEEMGVKALTSLKDLDSGAIIIRSHGVASEELQEASRKELEIVDATCPFVKKAQEHVKSLSQAGYVVVVVGDADHPEVQGIVSYAKGPVYVVGSGEEAGRLKISGKICIVAQTTQSFENLKNVVLECLVKGSEIRVFNTICDATAVRQEEAKELAKHVDCMIVIGGYNSANTTRLAQVCAELQPKTYHIETAQQLNRSWFEEVDTVGVTAGASTPKWVIDEVLEHIRCIDENTTH